MIWTFIGFCAAFLTMFSFVPQILKTLRSKSVEDVSIGTIAQLSCGVTLWIIYGIYLRNRIIIAANVVSLITMGILIYLYFIYRKAE